MVQLHGSCGHGTIKADKLQWGNQKLPFIMASFEGFKRSLKKW